MIEHSESIAKLADALCQAQSEVENARLNATNPHFKNQYADLPAVLEAVRPVLNKHGLSVVQHPGFEDGLCTLSTMLLHKSGEWMSAQAAAPVSRQDPQGIGSAVTYLRRYSLASVMGISQADDDGNAASGPRRAPPPPRKPAPRKETKAEKEKMEKLKELLADLPKKKADTKKATWDDAVSKAEAAKTEKDHKRIPNILQWFAENSEPPALEAKEKNK